MRFRAPVFDDAPAVRAVLAAREQADLGMVVRTLEDLRGEWRASDIDLEHDARVAEVDGTIAAYATVRRHGVLAAVAPEHEGRGIGTRLLEWAERREREQGREPHRQWVAAGNLSARALLSAAGYRKARSYLRLVRPLQNAPPAPEVPSPMRLRPVDPAHDAVALHALDAEAFAKTPDYVPESLEEFREEHLEAHDSAPGLSLIAEHDGRIVGFLIASRRDHENVGYVNLLAVAPDHQSRGIGTALLRAAFAGFAAAGLGEAQLMVSSDNPRAARVYERAGMKRQLQLDIYEREHMPSPSRWRSYRDVDAAGDPVSLAAQLDEIVTVDFVAREKRRSLDLLGLSASASVLDVGCGTGSDLGPLAEIVGPLGRVVGLERSLALLDTARARGLAHSATVELVRGEACALPFTDGEFDACRADRTLQHVEPPEAALAEMIRVLRPGGRMVVTESRWGLVAPHLDQDLTDRVLSLLAPEVGPADWLGHRLPVMFEQAGMADVQSVKADYSTGDAPELFRFTHLRGAVEELIRRGMLDGEQARAWLSRLDEHAEQGEAFAVVLILHVAGSRK